MIKTLHTDSCYIIEQKKKELVPFSVPVEGVFPESCGDFEGSESYLDKSPELQYLQVCLRKLHKNRMSFNIGEHIINIKMQWFNIFLCSTLSGLVEFDGFYLESDPCLVCNNPEVPFSVCITQLCLIKAINKRQMID